MCASRDFDLEVIPYRKSFRLSDVFYLRNTTTNFEILTTGHIILQQRYRCSLLEDLIHHTEHPKP
jgi:hypothetical protein